MIKKFKKNENFKWNAEQLIKNLESALYLRFLLKIKNFAHFYENVSFLLVLTKNKRSRRDLNPDRWIQSPKC